MVQKFAAAPSRPLPEARPTARLRGRDGACAGDGRVSGADGFAATSLDDISAATGLNRPSLYGAFGDKRALYLQAYDQYRKRVNEPFAPLFAAHEPLRMKLRRILTAALDLYLSGPNGPRGCFTVLSAASEAIADPDLHSLVGEAIDGTDRAFGRLFTDAREAGELPRRRRSAPARAHCVGDHPHAVDPRARPHSARRDRADHRRRRDDDLRGRKPVSAAASAFEAAGPLRFDEATLAA